MTQFARDWVRLYTGGKGTFAMTEMEDAGFMNAIERLGHMHRVDPDRVLVLRTGSNYSEERPGHTAVESVTAPYIGGSSPWSPPGSAAAPSCTSSLPTGPPPTITSPATKPRPTRPLPDAPREASRRPRRTAGPQVHTLFISPQYPRL